ncbi:ArsR/SmtB family transcription factor [Amycolatopsis thermophila]|uniref:DNA-binding transcriptional ArsR family regulator n=1 Tax=Amycolatopsis thermophila TaxID=206084 RepID=A0ABU0F415_9PSEU|nr:winged helix-turn-helix domain-containing protein [Amycolatopsis thermophila]MDQ0382320.1 DNA-binding transcriptional ArsR family regulator [Amycolatopsis thermophila]
MTGGDVDIARTAALFADPARVRVLTALGDGRALAASVLAAEAGLSAQGVSAHLAKLREAGLVEAERSGRHRFYRLAGGAAEILETLARFSPAQPVTSLRAGTRAQALRFARTCYDHLAGRLGVEVTAALVERGALVTTDGVPGTGRRPGDQLSKPMAEHPYAVGPAAPEVLGALGLSVDAVDAGRGRRPMLKFCLDWSEQRHHLAGALGAALAARFLDQGWLTRRRPGHRALRLTDHGADALADLLGVRLAA